MLRKGKCEMLLQLVSFQSSTVLTNSVSSAFTDSVDNIEYFNLSETTSSDCPSENSTGMSGYYGGSLKDFSWSYDSGEKVVW
jgi:hypothetical protein